MGILEAVGRQALPALALEQAEVDNIQATHAAYADIKATLDDFEARLTLAGF